MKKLALSIGLVAAILSAKAQDTTCTVVSQDKIYEFQYRPTKLLDKRDYEGYVYLGVKENEVLCLHLYDKQPAQRKVFVYLPSNEGETQKVISYTFDSESNLYFFRGPKEIRVLSNSTK
jgi:hypothetical protein|tara:strand:+ start:448 stop:804 length:357 start_codon:yes stop_codon:yes gene_type:complete